MSVELMLCLEAIKTPDNLTSLFPAGLQENARLLSRQGTQDSIAPSDLAILVCLPEQQTKLLVCTARDGNNWSTPDSESVIISGKGCTHRKTLLEPS